MIVIWSLLICDDNYDDFFFLSSAVSKPRCEEWRFLKRDELKETYHAKLTWWRFRFYYNVPSQKKKKTPGVVLASFTHSIDICSLWSFLLLWLKRSALYFFICVTLLFKFHQPHVQSRCVHHSAMICWNWKCIFTVL